MKKRILSLLLLVFITVSFFSLFSGYERIWNIWSIPVCLPHFTDVDMMTMGAESHAMGHDPLYNNPVHPWNKKLNYPRIWHALFALGIDRSHNNLIGSISVILFFIGLGIFLFSKKYDYLTIFFISAVVLSSSVMLGIERGNIELIIFFILSAALFAGYRTTTGALSLMLFASFLKLYPVFTFAYLLRERQRKFWTLFLSASCIFIAYALLTMDDLKQVYATSPKMAKSAYGMNVFWMGLTHPRILNLQLSDNIIMTAKVFTYVLFAAVFITAMLFSFKAYSAGKYRDGQYLDTFRVGAIIYIGCFIIGNNFDYRFTFLIFTIPQLVSWLRRDSGKHSNLILLTLLAIVFSCWNYTVKRIIGMKIGFILEETSNWMILSSFLFLFFSSLPEWAMQYIRRPFSIIRPSKREAVN